MDSLTKQPYRYGGEMALPEEKYYRYTTDSGRSSLRLIVWPAIEGLSHDLYTEELSLPVDSRYTPENIAYIVKKIKTILKGRGR